MIMRLIPYVEYSYESGLKSFVRCIYADPKNGAEVRHLQK